MRPCQQTTSCIVLLFLSSALVLSCAGDVGAPSDSASPQAEQTSCSPSNCTGCCLGNTCVSGTARSACGGRGLACVVCQGNEKCENKKCVPYSGKCDQFTCPTGCCKDSKCMPGMTNQACGIGGKLCVTCSPDKTCIGGACGVPGKCSISNCTGCCSGSSCKPGTTSQFCGKGGQPCSACGSGEQCLQGACKKNPKCGPGNCGGCCQGDTCQPGTLATQCGKGGQPCKACGAGQTCNGGVCGTPKCGPGNCTGCCRSSTCQPGTSTTQCGSGGQPCKPCGSGQTCIGGVCSTPKCGPGNCAGCCSSNTCVSGLSKTQCGTGGGACTSCKKYEHCPSGTCQLDPQSQWSIVLDYANLNTSKSWDPYPFNAYPDPFVVATLGSLTKTTSNKANTYNPVWKEVLFTTAAKEIINKTMSAVIKDQDQYTGPETIGTCSVSLSQSELLSGSKTVYNCNSYINALSVDYVAK